MVFPSNKIFHEFYFTLSWKIYIFCIVDIIYAEDQIYKIFKYDGQYNQMHFCLIKYINKDH